MRMTTWEPTPKPRDCEVRTKRNTCTSHGSRNKRRKKRKTDAYESYHQPAWVMEHRKQRPDRKVLLEQMDRWMEEYERKEQEEKDEKRKQEEQDQGWTVVTRKRGRKKTTDEHGLAVGAVSVAAAASAKKKIKTQGEMTHLYRFHKKEKRREELILLRERFEADKKRIAQMKAERMSLGVK